MDKEVWTMGTDGKVCWDCQFKSRRRAQTRSQHVVRFIASYTVTVENTEMTGHVAWVEDDNRFLETLEKS